MMTDAELIAAGQAIPVTPPPPAPDGDGGFASLERLEGGDMSPMPPDTGPSIQHILEGAERLRMLEGADTLSGAPVSVRAAVGASAPADRLTALREHYPDAAPLPGTDNFVYTDSAGKRVAYEPMGWRVPWTEQGAHALAGDAASLGPEIAEGAGALGGAAVGSLASPVVGTAIGGGAGAMAGREAYGNLMRFFGGSMDTRTAGQHAAEDAITGGVNAVLPGASEWMFGPAIGALFAPGADTLTQQAARALDVAGVTRDLRTTLPAGVAAESPGIQKIEQAMMHMPASGGLRESYADTKGAIGEGLQGLADSTAAPRPTPDPETFASNVAGIAKDIHGNFTARREALDQNLENEIGADTPVSIEPIRQLRADLAAKQSEAQESLAPSFQPAIDFLDKTIRDARTAGNMGQISFGAIRQIRRDLGDRVEWPLGTGADLPTGNPALRQAYGAYKASIQDAATAAGPDAQRALNDHDSLVSNYMADGGPNDTMTRLSDPATNANALPRLAQSTATADQNSLMHLWSAASPEQKQEIQAGMIQKLGTPASGADFDPATFARAYQKTTGGARDMVFGTQGTPLRDSLDNLMTVQKTVATSAANKNAPNTAPTLAIIAAMSGIAHYAMTGSPGQAAGVAASTFGAPWAAGKLMTSAPFVRWLSSTWGVNGARADQWARHLGRLGAVTAADPAMGDLVTRFRAGLPDTLPDAEAPGP